MHLFVPHLAADVEAERRRSARTTAATRDHAHPAGVRRAAAIVLARVSVASAAAVRRLDACIADDLVRPRVAVDGI